MIKKLNVIHIGWVSMEYSEVNIKKLNEATDSGIYQIYGAHPVYGQDVLLYIGKTEKQTFATRLKDRTEFNETVLRPKRIHIGRIYKSTDCKKENWEELIDIAESILIKAHTPAYNSTEIKGLFVDEFDEEYIIKNWYDYGTLLSEVSTMSVSYTYWHDVDNGGGEYLKK